MADRIAVGPFFGAAARASALARGSPLRCHRPRIDDRIVFCKLPYVSRIGRSYEAIACTSCSAGAIRNRRDGWIRLGVFARPQHIALESCDHTISAVLDQIAVDTSITKAPGCGEVTGRSPLDP
jgi:hypothetical protein